MSALVFAGCGRSSGNDNAAAPTAPGPVAAAPKNVIFFLGDGMGMNTLTAARIYAVGEDGDLTIDTLPESAFVKTY
ncbi:MAG TPA: alkaline phosphatase, partial [Noviherbaspirillum sp.]